MKYKAGKLASGEYAVMCGANNYFVSTVTESKEQADQKALKMSAIWYMEQAEKCLNEMTNKADIITVAHNANYLARTKTIERLESIGVEIDENDSHGYLA